MDKINIPCPNPDCNADLMIDLRSNPESVFCDSCENEIALTSDAPMSEFAEAFDELEESINTLGGTVEITEEK
ncbi:hypothetical protein [Vibrio vulnificus]|uniref:hypothetical protein n=1 Tax=Vibrio vulnificus TaxID=672 RepID=UPI001CDB9740|nr:hypothetical protein [Vibrio vulnificus]MCA3895234.1 hypothetical protein [Vibrio vulnificus]MCU8238738.1 hypothetical protein [Vibrio vulnificus]